jgi:hypothetical protein
VLSCVGRCLYDEPITRPKESYQMSNCFIISEAILNLNKLQGLIRIADGDNYYISLSINVISRLRNIKTLIYTIQRDRTSRPSDTTPTSHSESPKFKCRPADRLPLLRFSVVFFSPSWQMPRWYLQAKTGSSPTIFNSLLISGPVSRLYIV